MRLDELLILKDICKIGSFITQIKYKNNKISINLKIASDKFWTNLYKKQYKMVLIESINCYENVEIYTIY